MKSRDEIMIMMLQWMRLYTLGSRGSLNFFTNRSKVKEQRREIHAFKGRIKPNLWAIEVVVWVD